MGSWVGDWKAHQKIVDLIVRHPNVYTDTSSVRHYDYLVEAIKRAGPRKVLFGSDGPWIHPGVELEKIRLLGLSPSAQALVLSANILRMIGRAGMGSQASVIPAFERRRGKAQHTAGANYFKDGLPPAWSTSLSSDPRGCLV
jgi:uncharacterized protein